MPKIAECRKVTEEIVLWMVVSCVLSDDDWIEEQLGLHKPTFKTPLEEAGKSPEQEDASLALEFLNSECYFNERMAIRKPRHGGLYYTLQVYKFSNPDLF